MAAKFPIDAIFQSITAVSTMVTKLTPDAELQNKRFDAKAGQRRMNEVIKLLNKSVKYFNRHKLTVNEVDEYIVLIKQDEKFGELLKQRLQ